MLQPIRILTISSICWSTRRLNIRNRPWFWPKPWSVAYVQPSRRPTDGRYGENPNRLQHYYQFQVLIKPSPPNFQDLYLNSLQSIGIDPVLHDIRFVEDDWESPTLGAPKVGLSQSSSTNLISCSTGSIPIDCREFRYKS